MNLIQSTLGLLASLTIAAGAAAQTPYVEPGPSLPPELRKLTPAPAPSGAALRVQAMQKLKIRFEQADGNGNGMLTRDEATKAGFGFVATHFDEIDTSKRGAVTFDELALFMQQRRR